MVQSYRSDNRSCSLVHAGVYLTRRQLPKWRREPIWSIMRVATSSMQKLSNKLVKVGSCQVYSSACRERLLKKHIRAWKARKFLEVSYLVASPLDFQNPQSDGRTVINAKLLLKKGPFKRSVFDSPADISRLKLWHHRVLSVSVKEKRGIAGQCAAEFVRYCRLIFDSADLEEEFR